MYVRNPAIADGARLIDECYQRSLELLHGNCTAAGILACTESEKARARRYANVFGRDAAICSLGMIASGDPDLISAAENSLSTLATYQAPNGQIPKYVVPETGESDFWYLGCIDATLWWLIALKHFDRRLPERGLERRFAAEARKALNWLSCQEHPVFGLLQQNEASDWADIMPRSGFVLYTNALWYCVKRLYGLAQAEETRRYFNYLFMPSAGEDVEQRRAQLLAGLNQANGWEFNEWFHGRSGEPMGMPGQSWNAALFVLAADRLRSRTGADARNEDAACWRSPLLV